MAVYQLFCGSQKSTYNMKYESIELLAWNCSKMAEIVFSDASTWLYNSRKRASILSISLCNACKNINDVLDIKRMA